jgi:tetratricopeptide (TPR) repeat protein
MEHKDRLRSDDFNPEVNRQLEHLHNYKLLKIDQQLNALNRIVKLTDKLLVNEIEKLFNKAFYLMNKRLVENKFFPPTQSSEDGAYRVRVVNSTKGVRGNLIEKTSLLKFESQEEADTAYSILESGDIKLTFSDEPTNGLFAINSVSLIEKINYYQHLLECEKQFRKNDSSAAIFEITDSIESDNDRQAAIDLFTKIIILNPTFHYAYVFRGLLKGSAEMAKEAIVDFEKAIGLNPTDSFPYFCRAGLTVYFLGIMPDYLSLTESDIWRAESLKTFLIFNDSIGGGVFYIPSIYCKLAWELYYDSKEKAKIYIDKAIELDGKEGSNWEYYYYRYYIYSSGTDLGIYDLDKAIELGYDLDDVFVDRALLREKSQDYLGAIQDYDKALELFFDNRGIRPFDDGELSRLQQRFKALAILKFRIRDIEGGIKDFKSSFRYGGYSFEDFQELVIRLCELKHYNEAINECIAQINDRLEMRAGPVELYKRLIEELPKCYELLAKANELKGDLK